MTRFSTRYLRILLLLAIAGNAAAQDSSQDDLDALLQLLEQQTSLATNTRINADFVPGMISVLGAEQLQGRGFRNLWQALATVPGVLTTMDATGMRSISVRGIGGIFEPGKVKLLLNGRALNASASATTGTLYDTPVEQIERVEFIRGPGSAIHGEFAYAGVLNVITRKLGEYYSAALDSNGGTNASGLYGFKRPDGSYRASINLAASQTDGEDIFSGADRSPATIPGYAPGRINNKRDFVSAIIDVEAGNWNAILQLQQANRGDHFGSNYLLPPNRKQTVISDSVVSAELSNSFHLAGQFSGEWSINALQNSSDKNALFLGVAPAFGGFAGDADIVADSRLTEQRYGTGVKLQYDGMRHQLFGELVYAEVRVDESEQFINLDPATNLPSPTLNEFPGPVDRSQRRRSLSLALQDEYRIDERLTLTSGLRFDDYQDIGSNLSPRIALVWRHSSSHIFKTQLARAFRPPSLIELGGAITPSIDAETNDTIEFGHIFQDGNLVLRNTLFYSRLDDLIVFNENPPLGYSNAGAHELIGYELEVEKSIAQRWQINASLALQDYADEGLPGAAPWILKLGADHMPSSLTRLNIQVLAISKRERESADARARYEQTTMIDAGLQKRNFLGHSGLEFGAGVKNILDRRLAHLAPAGTYPDDFPFSDGATLWLQLSYQP